VVSAGGFADCVAAGGTVSAGPPQQCTTSDGKAYIDAPPFPGPGANRNPMPPR
jgi:hypothetical protein